MKGQFKAAYVELNNKLTLIRVGDYIVRNVEFLDTLGGSGFQTYNTGRILVEGLKVDEDNTIVVQEGVLNHSLKYDETYLHNLPKVANPDTELEPYKKQLDFIIEQGVQELHSDTFNNFYQVISKAPKWRLQRLFNKSEYMLLQDMREEIIKEYNQKQKKS